MTELQRAWRNGVAFGLCVAAVVVFVLKMFGLL